MQLSKYRNVRGAAALSSALALTLFCGGKPAQAVITVNFTVGSDLNNSAQRDMVVAGFQRAASRWTSVFNNTFNLNLSIDYRALGTNVIGQAGSSRLTTAYTNYRSSLVAQAASVDDIAAANSLPATSLPILINRTSDRPMGTNLETPYLDDNGDENNTTIRMNTANAKALGILDATDAVNDASITFSSNFSFDFDPDDGIDPNQVDFVGVATHEIGHALGFVSGVDILDGNGTGDFPSSAFTYVSPLDTFRFSSESVASGNAIDFSADNRDKYFSLDGGRTKIASFSTGVRYGDGRQASHWKDNLGIGIMDPTAGRGELLAISDNDLRAFDVIGYRLYATDAPEPTTLGLIGFAGLGLAGARRLRSRRRQTAK